MILPILLAAFFALLLSPMMKRLASSWLPRWIAALLLIALTMATIVGIGNVLYAPAAEWVGRAPQVMRNVTPKLKSLMRPIAEANKMGESLSEIAGEGKHGKQQVVVQTQPSRPSLLTTTPRVLASVLAVVLLTYFFLLYGDSLLRRTLMMRSTWEKKRITVDIVRSIQSTCRATSSRSARRASRSVVRPAACSGGLASSHPCSGAHWRPCST